MSGNVDTEDIIKRAYDLAYENEARYGCCPQAVLAAIQDLFGHIPDEVIKSVHGLAGGTGLSTKGTCGALVGGITALSYFFGRPRDQFGEGRYENNYDLSQDLYDRFVIEIGSPICRDVQETLMDRSYQISDPEEYDKFEEQGAHVDKCPSVTGRVASWTAEMLIDNGVDPVSDDLFTREN